MVKFFLIKVPMLFIVLVGFFCSSCTVVIEQKTPDYYLHRIELSDDSLNYMFITDLHIDSDDKMGQSYQVLSTAVIEANNNDKIDFICIGGDLTTLWFSSKTEWSDWVDHILKPLKQSEKPVFILRGNHDDNSNCKIELLSEIPLLNKRDWNENVINKYVNVDIVRDFDNNEANYYYYDYEKNNTNYRIICLDSSDHTEITTSKLYWGFSESQVNWLNKQVLNDYEGYCIVLSHMPISQRYNGDGERIVHYSKEITSTLKSYNEKTDNILLHSFGHLHLRYLGMSEINVPFSCTTCMLSGGPSGDDGSFVDSTINDKQLEWETLNRYEAYFAYDVFSVNSTSIKRFVVGPGNNKTLFRNL